MLSAHPDDAVETNDEVDGTRGLYNGLKTEAEEKIKRYQIIAEKSDKIQSMADDVKEKLEEM